MQISPYIQWRTGSKQLKIQTTTLGTRTGLTNPFVRWSSWMAKLMGALETVRKLPKSASDLGCSNLSAGEC